MNFRERMKNIFCSHGVVSLLCLIFGISSWIEVSGLFVELPLMYSRLPEGDFLGSYVVILTQAANVGPLLYSLAIFKWNEKVPNKLLIHVSLLVATTSCILLLLFWDKTTYIGGAYRSTALLTLAFFLATVDCTSSVLYLPYIGKLRRQHLMPLLIGEGVSGLLPALVALAQGVGGNPTCVIDPTNATNQSVPHYSDPRFSIETFFGVLVAMLVASWAAFTTITYMPTSLTREVIQEDTDEYLSNADCNYLQIPDTENCGSQHPSRQPRKPVTMAEYKGLLFLQCFSCFLTNSFMPSLQSFSCLAYGNVAYHLAVVLSSLSAPLSGLLALWWWSTSVKVMSSLTALGLTCTAYLISTAALSPKPPLFGTKAGEIIVVLTWALFTGSFAYLRNCVASRFRLSDNPKDLFYLGALAQVGSFTGAVFSFPLINYSKLFSNFNPCS